MLLIALPHVQDLGLGLVEHHEVRTVPLLQLGRCPWMFRSLQRVGHTAQLGAVGRCAAGSLDPTVRVTDKHIKQHWSQCWPLGTSLVSTGTSSH